MLLASISDRPRERFSLLLALLVAVEFSVGLGSTMIYSALATLYALFGDPTRVTWLITAYFLTSAVSAALCGRLGDVYGRRRMLLLILAVATVGSAISAVANDLTVIIFGRALQGLGMAILPLAFGILRENARDARDLNLGVGVLGGTYSLSAGVGFLLGGAIVDNWRWQHVFSVSGAAAALVLIFAFRFLPKDHAPKSRGRLDWLGALFVLPTSALLLALTFGRSLGWGSPVIVMLLAGGAASLAGWALHELRHRNPLIDIRLLSNPTILVVNVAIFFTAMAPMIYAQVILPLLQQPAWTGVGFGFSATVGGILKMPTNATSALAGIGAGLVARRHSMRPAIIAAALANCLAFGSLICLHGSVVFVVAMCIFLIAPAVTIFFGCAPALIIEAAPPERTSEATGLSSMLRAVAMAIGTQVIAYSMATSEISNREGVSFPDEHAYATTFMIMTGCCLASLLLALLIPGGGSVKESGNLSVAPARRANPSTR